MVMHMSLTTSTLILGPAGIAGGNLLTYDFALAGAMWGMVAVVAVANRGRLEHRSGLALGDTRRPNQPEAH
jgi:hypothetical protein